MRVDCTTPTATTAGSSTPCTAGSSPPSSTPPVPVTPQLADSEHIVVGNFTIPAHLQTAHLIQSTRIHQALQKLSPRQEQAPQQKTKAAPSKSQPKDKDRGSYRQRTGATYTGQRTAAMPTLVPSTLPAHKPASGNVSKKISCSDTRAALARMKTLKTQMISHSCDLASVHMELDAVEKMIH